MPEVLVFDNTDVIPFITTAFDPTGLSIKHAAMIGKADVYFSVLLNETLPLSAPPTLEGVPKGAALSVEFLPAYVKVGVGKTGKDVLRETPFTEVKEGKITHIVAVGGPNNFRYLRYRTPINFVP